MTGYNPLVNSPMTRMLPMEKARPGCLAVFVGAPCPTASSLRLEGFPQPEIQLSLIMILTMTIWAIKMACFNMFHHFGDILYFPPHVFTQTQTFLSCFSDPSCPSKNSAANFLGKIRQRGCDLSHKVEPRWPRWSCAFQNDSFELT